MIELRYLVESLKNISSHFRSIRKVLAVSILSAVLYSSCQFIMESFYPDPSFRVHNGSTTFDLFAHGGAVFCMTTSAICTVIYAIALMMPLFPCTKRLVAMPNKPAFYQYCAFLMILYMLKGLGSCLVFFRANANGLCLLNLSAFLYVSLFAPVVFLGFINSFFSSGQPTLLFSYKAQVKSSLWMMYLLNS